LLATRGPDHQLTIVAACHLAACFVDQGKYSRALPLLQVRHCALRMTCDVSLHLTAHICDQPAIHWFESRRIPGGPSPFAGLSDDVAKQYAHAQILLADCLIADARAYGDSSSLLAVSIETANAHQSQLALKPNVAASAFESGASNMDGDSAAPNDAGQADALPTVICDACEIVLPTSALWYRCTSCPDFHLCAPCHAKYEHCKECHEFEVMTARTSVPTRPLCAADAHLRSALALPNSANLLGDPIIMKAKACIAEYHLYQGRHSECESICRAAVQVIRFFRKFCRNLIFSATSLLFPQSFASENWPPVLIRTVKMCLGMCLAAQFQWDESQTIFEEVLSHNDERKGRNSADSLAISLQISEQVYR